MNEVKHKELALLIQLKTVYISFLGSGGGGGGADGWWCFCLSLNHFSLRTIPN